MSQDEINNEVQIRLAVHDEKFNSFMRSMEDFKEEMKDFKEEMRQQNQMRAAENAEIRNEIREISKSTDAKIDGMGKHIRNLTYTSIAAIAAMVITVMLNLPK
ncbi:MAG: hypothetical protein IJU55_06495 [Selenomonadaceae bacterium]|nr:hypothetical protein [Selenomonadaceae bacterium]